MECLKATVLTNYLHVESARVEKVYLSKIVLECHHDVLHIYIQTYSTFVVNILNDCF